MHLSRHVHGFESLGGDATINLVESAGGAPSFVREVHVSARVHPLLANSGVSSPLQSSCMHLSYRLTIKKGKVKVIFVKKNRR